MKTLFIFISLLVTLAVFAKEFDGEAIFEKISEKKYSMLKEKVTLTADEEKKLMPILKTYDKKIFDLRMNHLKDGKGLFKSKDYDKILKHQKEGLNVEKSIFELRQKEIEEIEKAKIKAETIVKLSRFEMEFMHKFMNKFKERKQKRDKNEDFDDFDDEE